EQECAERLSTAAEEHERQLAHQTSLLKQKEAQLHTQEQEHQRLAEDHAALQTALAREYEKLAAAESARQTAASALAEKEQECEQLTAAAEEHERQLAHQESLYQTAETACQTAETSLKQKERDYERLVEAYQQLAQVLVSSVVFGEKQWEQYFGKVGTAPRLPIEIGEVLSSPCPFCPDQQVKDTHLLVLIPSTVNDKPFSLNLLGELIRKPKAGNYRTKYRYYDRGVQDVLGNKQSFNHSYWVLITRDVLPSSRKKRYGDQKGLIAGHVHYDVPYALEAATAALLHYARTGKPLYTADPWTYTRCQDLVDNYPTVVGGFNGSGLSVSYDFSDDSVDRYGVAGCRRFSYQP
nr:hypothetical protein [Amoebophilaceae bacterium]